MKNKKTARQEKLYAEREDAGLRLDILTNGIGDAFKCSEGTWGAERTRRILEFANQELPPALARAEAAHEAYLPYRRRFHRTRLRTSKKKTAPKARPKQKRRKKAA